VIDVEAGKSVKTEIKIADGYKFEKGFVSPHFINNKEKQLCELIDPFILLYEKRVTHHTQIERLLEAVSRTGRPIVIICEDADEEGLAFLVMNNYQKRLACCVVKSPSFGEGRREEMEDIAILTGGQYITDSKGVGIKEAELAHLGTAKKVIVTKDETIIIGGDANRAELENLLNELRMNLAQAKNEDEAFPIEKRIAKLTGGVAVIQVGANTETEMKEKLDRFDDAVRATKSAIAEGFVPGAGTIFLRIKTGNPVIDAILEAPLKQICLNAGVDADEIVKKVKEATGNIGYNAKTDEIADLVEVGIIDPAKVLRCSIQNAASVASMILTTQCLIADTL
jgi:chaperonin GroEL